MDGDNEKSAGNAKHDDDIDEECPPPSVSSPPPAASSASRRRADANILSALDDRLKAKARHRPRATKPGAVAAAAPAVNTGSTPSTNLSNFKRLWFSRDVLAKSRARGGGVAAAATPGAAAVVTSMPGAVSSRGPDRGRAKGAPAAAAVAAVQPSAATPASKQGSDATSNIANLDNRIMSKLTIGPRATTPGAVAAVSEGDPSRAATLLAKSRDRSSTGPNTAAAAAAATPGAVSSQAPDHTAAKASGRSAAASMAIRNQIMQYHMPADKFAKSRDRASRTGAQAASIDLAAGKRCADNSSPPAQDHTPLPASGVSDAGMGNVSEMEMYPKGKCIQKGNVSKREMYLKGKCIRNGNASEREMYPKWKCIRKRNVYEREMIRDEGGCTDGVIMGGDAGGLATEAVATVGNGEGEEVSQPRQPDEAPPLHDSSPVDPNPEARSSYFDDEVYNDAGGRVGEDYPAMDTIPEEIPIDETTGGIKAYVVPTVYSALNVLAIKSDDEQEAEAKKKCVRKVMIVACLLALVAVSIAVHVSIVTGEREVKVVVADPPSASPTSAPSSMPILSLIPSSMPSLSLIPSSMPSLSFSLIPSSMPSLSFSLITSSMPSLAPTTAGLLLGIKSVTDESFILDTLPDEFRDAFTLFQEQNVSTLEQLEDRTSPQSKAMNWVSNEDPMQLNHDDPKFLQRYIMALFYFSLDGDNWLSCGRGFPCFRGGSPWLSDEDECDWFGNSCVDGKMSQFLQGTSLGNGVRGEFPKEICYFTEMKRIDLKNNFIRGTIPGCFGRFSKLEQMSLTNNEIELPIPDEAVEGWKSLLKLFLGSNKLKGQFPANLLELSPLQKLRVDFNELTGPFPAFNPAGTPLLIRVDLSRNSFRGEIPASLFDISSLKHVNMTNNFASGSLPPNIGRNFTDTENQLTHLDFGKNDLIGEIPDSLYNAEGLTHLHLSFNNFTGEIRPDIFTSLRNLQSVALDNNVFSGPVPETLSDPSQLNVLALQGNNFNGKISDTICDAKDQSVRIDFRIQQLTLDCGEVDCDPSCCEEGFECV